MQLVGQSLVFSAGILQDAGVELERREIIDTLTAQVISQVRTLRAVAARCPGTAG